MSEEEQCHISDLLDKVPVFNWILEEGKLKTP